MLFEWDPEKDRSNRAKHGISFQTVVPVFFDPFALAELDGVVDGEERWKTTGLVRSDVIVLVAHTVEDSNGEENIRIISARRATRTERARYEAHRAKAQERA